MGCARANVRPPLSHLRKRGQECARARVREQWSPLTKGGYRGVRGRTSTTRALAAGDHQAIAAARGNRNRSGLPGSSKAGNACRSRVRRTGSSGKASSRIRWYHGSGAAKSRGSNSRLAGMSWRNTHRSHPTVAGPSDPSDRRGRSRAQSFLPDHKGSGRPGCVGHSRTQWGGRRRTRLQSPMRSLSSRPRMTDSSLPPLSRNSGVEQGAASRGRRSENHLEPKRGAEPFCGRSASANLLPLTRSALRRPVDPRSDGS
jgi:hypothetical protein